MKFKPTHLVAAAAVVAGLAFGGVSLASAQDSGSTTTTTPSESTAPQAGPRQAPDGQQGPHGQNPGDCPNMGGSGTQQGPSGSGTPGTGFGAGASSGSNESI